SSELFARIKSAGAMGLRVASASFDYAAMADRKDQVVQKLRNGVKQLLKANSVTVFQGSASFQTRNRIQVDPVVDAVDRGRETVMTFPLPPNRTGGSPASGSPVGGVTCERTDRRWHER